MARRRSKWRRTSTIMKKLMQEARKVRAFQSLQQCPMCGDPHGLTIAIKMDKELGKKSAYVKCSSCGFEYFFETIPVIADEFWVYSKLLDMVQSGTLHSLSTKEASKEVAEATTIESVAEETTAEEADIGVEGSQEEVELETEVVEEE